MLRGTGTHHLIILDLEVYQDSTIVNFRFLQKQTWESPIDWEVSKFQNYSSKSQYCFFLKHIFDLVGRCLCFHTSGFSNLLFFNFQISKNYQESTLLNSFSQEYPAISYFLIQENNPGIIKCSKFPKMSFYVLIQILVPYQQTSIHVF